MDFPYTEADFSEKNEEVWKFVNGMDLESIFRLISKLDDKKIKGDLISVFKEKLRWISTAESVCLLELVQKKFSLENYFLEVALLEKISGF